MRIPLTGGAYTAKSLIANAQACVNLYPERNPDGAPVPFTYYLREGLTQVSAPPVAGVSRGLYRTGAGDLFEVVGAAVYHRPSDFSYVQVGTITAGATPVSMVDNGLVLVLVDGSANGYVVDLSAYTFGTINDPSFAGANRVEYADTYFIFNVPGTAQWRISLSNADFGMLCGQAIDYSAGDGGGSITTPGSGYVDATYTAVALTGGLGSGAQATIIVSGGAVTSVVITNGGAGYQVSDALSASASTLGGTGSGFVWTVSMDGAGAFDPLDIASKSGGNDNLATLIVLRREVWLLGAGRSTEVWYNAGAADFAYQILPGVFIEHGIAAIFSLAKEDNAIYWLSQDDQGRAIVVTGENYQAKRISTHALEQAFSTYSTISDAIGFTFQLRGHTFYQLSFPTADATWTYDVSVNEWHQRTWTDTSGLAHRHRAICATFAYGANLCGDCQTGALYKLDQTVDTDAGQPINWRRSFPHLLNDAARAAYSRFIADVDTGGADKAIGLRWSDDRGHTFKADLYRSAGIAAFGQSLMWPRLGIGRDRVFELFGTGQIALNGAFVNATPVAT